MTRLFEDVFIGVELLQWHPKVAVLCTQVINMQIESLGATSPTIHSRVIINWQLEAATPPAVMAPADILLKVLSSIHEKMGKGAPRIPLANVEVVFCKASNAPQRQGEEVEMTDKQP